MQSQQFQEPQAPKIVRQSRKRPIEDDDNHDNGNVKKMHRFHDECESTNTLVNNTQWNKVTNDVSRDLSKDVPNDVSSNDVSHDV